MNEKKYLLLSVVFYLSPTLTLAQIVPDATLPINSTVTSEGNTRIIEGGTRSQSNLFHSFREFSIPTGGTAFFNNAKDILNIFSRVTGSSVSNIDGLIKANGTANLFLINPNGIIFGPNASLNVGGSFLASTASGIKFADGTEFNAPASNTTPLLTVSIPLGLRFRGTEGRIITRANLTNNAGRLVGLEVQPGKTLALIGGDVELDNATLQAPSGQIELGGLADIGTVDLLFVNNNWHLRFPDGIARSNVSLFRDASVNVAGNGGGNIAINARNLEVLESSQIAAGIAPGMGSSETQAGNIAINASESIRVENSLITNSLFAGASGTAGNISIDTGSLSVIGGNAQINSLTAGNGNAGNIAIQAKDTVSLSGGGENIDANGILTIGAKEANGNTGNIQIAARFLSLTDRALVSTSNLGKGSSGNITIQVADTVSLAGGLASILTNTDSLESGKAGNIKITAKSVSVTNGASLMTATAGQGDAGDITIQASGEVLFDGGDSVNSIASSVLTLALGGSPLLGLEAKGKAGNIAISAGSVSLRNGALLSAISATEKGSGNITIKAADSISVSGGAVIQTQGLGPANAGNVIIEAGGNVSFDGVGLAFRSLPENITPEDFSLFQSLANVPVSSGVSTAVSSLPPLFFTSTGQGGNIKITARSVSVTNGAMLNTSTLGQGNAGNITIQANGTVSFDGSAPVSSAIAPTQGGIIPNIGRPIRYLSGAFSSVGAIPDSGIRGTGRGGNIQIQAQSVSVTSGAQLSTLTSGGGDAGNILINASDSVEISRIDSSLAESSGLFSTTEDGAGGKGGEIRVNTNLLRVSDGAVLSARTRSAFRSGDINVNVNTLEVTNGGQLQTTAFSTGSAGDILVSAADEIAISGSDPTFANRVQKYGETALSNDGADSGILVRSRQAEEGAGNAGTIQVNARSLRLDNQGTITGASASVNGGNIALQVPELLVMRRNSGISASAGTAQAGGNGGNLTINTDVLAALENSDIAANAFEGNGGSINITTQGIFGTELRDRQTQASDITASSTFGRQGEVTLNTPVVDPRAGLVELPQTVVDPDGLIARNPCALGKGSEFTRVGRGGLPPSPGEALSVDAIRVELVDDVSAQTAKPSAIAKPPTRSTVEPIVLARGWIVNEKGEVVLVPYDFTGTGYQRLWNTANTCSAP